MGNAQLKKNVTTYNMDARDFITKIAKEDKPITQIVMNLPVSAELFCDVFRTCFSVFVFGSYYSQEYSHPLPMVHCYMFSSSEDPLKDSVEVI